MAQTLIMAAMSGVLEVVAKMIMIAQIIPTGARIFRQSLRKAVAMINGSNKFVGNLMDCGRPLPPQQRATGNVDDLAQQQWKFTWDYPADPNRKMLLRIHRTLTGYAEGISRHNRQT